MVQCKGFGLWLVVIGAVSLAVLGCSSDDDDDHEDIVDDDDDTSGGDDDDDDDDTIENPPREAYETWLKVEPEGQICSDGSQYKFFVNYSETSDNVMFVLEPGGACWDYESCAGKAGIRGAANPHGIPDNHMSLYGIHTPLFWREWDAIYPEQGLPTQEWNYVFIPYCTGDIHSGNRTIAYHDPDGIEPDLVFHHNGHSNVISVIDWTRENFPSLPKMLVTGCSAGGVGALANYYFFREGLPQVERGYLLDDSGPIYPDSEFSLPLHQKVKDSWNVESVLPSGYDFSDFGNINTILADAFPEDRLSITYFRRDYNYSLYSYERFYDFPPKAEIMRMWWEDTKKLTAQYDTRDNLSYFIPYFRGLNDSHCTLIVSYSGTEIEEAGVDLHGFIANLLDDATPQQSWLESPHPEEDEPWIDYDDYQP